MYVPEGEIGFRIYWEDMFGKRNQLFSSALSQEQALSEGMEYIKNHVYLASFKIVGLEQIVNHKWEKINIKTIYCEGR